MKRTFPFVTGGLCAGLSFSEDDSSLDSSFFFPFAPPSRWAFHTYIMRKRCIYREKKSGRRILLDKSTYPGEDLLRRDWCTVLRTWYGCGRRFEADDLFADLGFDIRFGRDGGFLFCLLVRFCHGRRPRSEVRVEKRGKRWTEILKMDMKHYVSEIRQLRDSLPVFTLPPRDHL